mmetsp:Transcript_3988/g.8958  ORF Transcript_3988/g.8958 Transcript_3988/m.8958 type:complete len:279 (-) Transcript_3988:316-1152(-)
MTSESEEQEWIEAPDAWGPTEDPQGNDNDGTMLDLFGKDDPSDIFTFQIKYNNNSDAASNKTKTIRLSGFKLDSDEVDRSTGVTIWAAAPRLAHYLQEHAESTCEGKSVLELGAGLGLCGITAYYLGANMTMTDGDTHSLRKMRENVRHNCSSSSGGDGYDNDDNETMSASHNTLDCRQLLWGSPHMEKYLKVHGQSDTILGADVIYTEASIKPLFDTVACLLKPDGQFILSRVNKWNGVENEVVIEAAKARKLYCTRPSEGIFVFRWNEVEESGGDN